MTKKKIAIIGAGACGQALAKLFHAKHQVYLIGRQTAPSPEWVPSHFAYAAMTQDEGRKPITEADYIFIVVPTQANRQVFQTIQPYINSGQPIILCSKGFEQNTNKLPHEIAMEYFPDNPLLALSGPNFASEIKRGLPAITTLACQYLELAQKIAAILSTENFVMYPHDDLISTEIFGAIKNVIAIGGGISLGIDLGENFKAAVITRLIIETQKLITYLGGKIDSIISPSGIGDIILTCTSKQSRNTNYGIALVNNAAEVYLESHTVEGYFTLNSVYQIAKKNKILLPIISYLYNVAYQNKNISKREFVKIINSH